MNSYLLGNAIDDIFNFFSSSLRGIDYDVIFGIGVGLLAVFFIIGFFRALFCYESKTLRGLYKINKYLLQNPAINESNLVAFHNLIKKMPSKIRDRWQLYVLERDGLPSRYLTTEYCIRRPLANSVLVSVKKQVMYAAIVVAVITFVLGLGYALAHAQAIVNISSISDIFIYSFTTPAIVIMLAVLFVMAVQLRINVVNNKIYEVFNTFVRNVNRAVATMPDSIDYEVLFTQKEIDEGIPILREYLEKKALEEQQLLEQSKYNAISHSPYNFEDLGVDGEQLITRAVSESENFLMKKIGIENEIQEYEKKQSQSEANMDEIEKEANRKLQTIKENLERLDKAIAETTNRVEINYNRRQIKDEMEKRALIEKDLKSLLSKEQVVINECKAEIQKRKDLIDKDKNEVEKALKSEYNTFAVKVYDTLNDKVSEENADAMKEYQTQIVDLKAKLQNISRELENKDAVIAEKDLEISNLSLKKAKASENFRPQIAEENSQPEQMLDQQEQITEQEDVNSQYAGQPEQTIPEDEQAPNEDAGKPNLMTTENALQQDENYYDEDGNLIDYSQYYDEDGNLIDYSQYYDENGNLIDYSQYYDENGNYIGPVEQENNQEENKEEQVTSENKDEDGSQTLALQEEIPVEDNSVIMTDEDDLQNIKKTKSKKGKKSPKDKAKEEKAKTNTEAVADIEPQTDQPAEQSEQAESLPENMDVLATVETQAATPVEEQKTDVAEQNETAESQPVMMLGEPQQESVLLGAPEETPATEEKKTPKKKATSKTGKKATTKTSAKKSATKTSSGKPSAKSTTKKTGAKNTTTKKAESPKTATKTSAKKGASKTKSTTSTKKKAEKEPTTPVEDRPAIESQVNDAFSELQKQIDEQNQKLQQQQDELRVQIDKAIDKIEKSSTENSRKNNIRKIKILIEKLKEQAKEAKARGATKEEIKQINSSVADLVDALTKYSSKK